MQRIPLLARSAVVAAALFVIAPAVPAQDSTATLAERPVNLYDVVRVRSTPAAMWLVGTVVAVARDTILLSTQAPPGRPSTQLRVALDTVDALERRALVPGSTAMAAVEGLYWGTIAGAIMGWLGGATYGALAGGARWTEAGRDGLFIGAGSLGAAGAITLGVRHMRGANGEESVRTHWVRAPLPVNRRSR